jgi:hypothetical protein
MLCPEVSDNIACWLSSNGQGQSWPQQSTNTASCGIDANDECLDRFGGMPNMVSNRGNQGDSARDMLSLALFFLEILQLRRTPAEVPASNTIFLILFALDCALAAVAFELFGSSEPLLRALTANVALLFMLAGVFWLKRAHARFLQSTNAALGASAVLYSFGIAIGLLYQSIKASLGPVLNEFFSLTLLTLEIWLALVIAHILRCALGLRFWQALLIAIAMQVVQFALARLL